MWMQDRLAPWRTEAIFVLCKPCCRISWINQLFQNEPSCKSCPRFVLIVKSCWDYDIPACVIKNNSLIALLCTIWTCFVCNSVCFRTACCASQMDYSKNLYCDCSMVLLCGISIASSENNCHWMACLLDLPDWKSETIIFATIFCPSPACTPCISALCLFLYTVQLFQTVRCIKNDIDFARAHNRFCTSSLVSCSLVLRNAGLTGSQQQQQRTNRIYYPNLYSANRGCKDFVCISAFPE